MKIEIPKWLQEEAAAYDIALSPAPATVLDIGANIGAFAVRVRAKWPRAAIRCYEPVAENYETLIANLKIKTHHPKLVRAYRFAVRNFCGHDKIFIGDHGVTCGFHQLGRQTGVTERVMCVDAAGVPGAELVKIDTEGCEVEILSRLDLRKTRALVVEYHRVEDVARLNAIALAAGLELLEQTPGSQTHGILKYVRPGVAIAQIESPPAGPRCAAADRGASVPAGRSENSEPETCNHQLSTRKIYCAVASHFSNHDLVFLQSMMQLLLGAQVRMSFGWSCDPSVERARNVLTANFLATDCTHLLFIDSDIAFTPRDVMRVISHDEDVVGGIYPLKTMDRDVKWCGNGLGDSSSNGGAGVPASRSEVRPDGLQEVGCIGTGFMCLARRVFKKIIAADGDKIRYQQDWPPHREEFAFWRQTVRDAGSVKVAGDIIGEPLAAGYQGAFDFYYADWQWCADFDTGEPFGYFFGWGQDNNYAAQNHGIPRTATHWTPNNIGWQMPGGAWIFYNLNPSWSAAAGACNTNFSDNFNFPPATVLIAQKWAETKMGFPSQNFFRPAGDDKFSLDQENTFAINSISGSNVYLINAVTCNPITANGAGLWGGNAVNGFFEVSGNGNPFTLGTKMFDLPSDWQSPASDTANCFGLLRFPNAFPILGAANVSNVANTSPVELTTDALPNLGMGVANANADHIDIFDSQMNLLTADQAVTRIDDSHFTVGASFAAIQNAGIIMSNGAPDYYWDDQFPKGDYVYTDWTWWPRLLCEANRWNNLVAACPPEGKTCSCPSGSETVYCFPFFNPVEDDAGSFSNAFHQEANCVPFSPCSPAVLCISPNGESFDNGTTYDFPSIYLDEEYGSGWQAEFQQVMQDLLYQAPHFPCPSIANCATPNFAWTEDGGSCAGDSNAVHYYAHAPLVEARISLPSGAPSLPSGINIGWSSPAGLTSCAITETGQGIDVVSGDTLFPPNSNGYGLAVNTLWALWLAECNCIANAERFASQYSNDVLGCQ